MYTVFFVIVTFANELPDQWTFMMVLLRKSASQSRIEVTAWRVRSSELPRKTENTICFFIGSQANRCCVRQGGDIIRPLHLHFTKFLYQILFSWQLCGHWKEGLLVCVFWIAVAPANRTENMAHGINHTDSTIRTLASFQKCFFQWIVDPVPIVLHNGRPTCASVLCSVIH